MHFLQIVLQILVALGLINVWLIRSQKDTSYRGGNARNIKEEFEAYGLPSWFVMVIGILKISIAIALLIGLFIPALVAPAATILVMLMIGAVLMHVKVKDPIKKSLPATAMLLMSLLLLI